MPRTNHVYKYKYYYVCSDKGKISVLAGVGKNIVYYVYMSTQKDEYDFWYILLLPTNHIFQ